MNRPLIKQFYTEGDDFPNPYYHGYIGGLHRTQSLGLTDGTYIHTHPTEECPTRRRYLKINEKFTTNPNL